MNVGFHVGRSERTSDVMTKIKIPGQTDPMNDTISHRDGMVIEPSHVSMEDVVQVENDTDQNHISIMSVSDEEDTNNQMECDQQDHNSMDIGIDNCSSSSEDTLVSSYHISGTFSITRDAIIPITDHSYKQFKLLLPDVDDFQFIFMPLKMGGYWVLFIVSNGIILRGDIGEKCIFYIRFGGKGLKEEVREKSILYLTRKYGKKFKKIINVSITTNEHYFNDDDCFYDRYRKLISSVLKTKSDIVSVFEEK